ncbi:ABC transporter permease [Mycolicibacterium goodii]|uniref:ABC transporter permease n=1 Tax=Mycolicibacterium goodii TaxID=134601 RepID=UPI001BDD84AC|nr:ABC transporter permease [Mycolicibacterium goodii]MBU8833274.1 ABC transporter permease [Mycolicibacterium goodii]
MAVGKRLLDSLIVTAIVVVLSFVLVHLVPGDPARTILGFHASPDKVTALRSSLGLDQPLLTQFISYIGDVVRGKFGQSVAHPGRSVESLLLPPLSVTLSVIAVTVVFSVIIGALSGLTAALSRSGWIRSALEVLSTTSLATPPFLLGLIMLVFVAVRWGMAPAGGWAGNWPDNAQFVWLPALALSAYLGALVHRAVWTSARQIMNEDFIEAAVLRGHSPLRVALRHILPNSLMPTISVVGMNIGTLIGGAAVIEAVFDLPGIGTQLVNAVSQRDYPTIQGAAVITALIVLAGNLLADLLHAAVDPRARS